jgi:hypothetical protein
MNMPDSSQGQNGPSTTVMNISRAGQYLAIATLAAFGMLLVFRPG